MTKELRALVYKPYDMKNTPVEVHDYINHLRLAILDCLGVLEMANDLAVKRIKREDKKRGATLVKGSQKHSPLGERT